MTSTRNADQSDQQLAACFDGCLATSARMIDRAITSAFDEALRPLDIKPTQVSLIVTIAALGTPTQRELAPALNIDQTTLSRNLDRLIDRGLVTPLDAEDQRTVPYQLTTAGRKILKEARPRWTQAQQAITDLLGPNADALRQAAATLAS